MKKPISLEERARNYGKAAVAFLDQSANKLQRMKDDVGDSLQGLLATSRPDKEPSNPPTSTSNAEEARLSSAIEKLKGRDMVGVVSEYGASVGGAALGLAAAGKVAALAGASTLMGSTALASVLGGVFVVSTPVGWVLGSAAVAGTAAYALTKLARSGAKQDVARKDLIERLTQRLQTLRQRNQSKEDPGELQSLLAITISAELISEDYGKRLVEMVERGSLPVEIATTRLRDLALEANLILATNQ